MKTTLKTQPRQIRLPTVLWRDLEREATRDNKSRAELIRGVLTDFVKWRQKREEGK